MFQASFVVGPIPSWLKDTSFYFRESYKPLFYCWKFSKSFDTKGLHITAVDERMMQKINNNKKTREQAKKKK